MNCCKLKFLTCRFLSVGNIGKPQPPTRLVGFKVFLIFNPPIFLGEHAPIWLANPCVSSLGGLIHVNWCMTHFSNLVNIKHHLANQPQRFWSVPTTLPRLDELMRRGVPAQQRGEIWFEISGASDTQQRWKEIHVTWHGNKDGFTKKMGIFFCLFFPALPFKVLLLPQNCSSSHKSCFSGNWVP